MARSIFSNAVRVPGPAAVAALVMLLASPLPSLAESPMTKQHIAFGSGHFVVTADPTVERYKLIVGEIPGKCKPELKVEEKDAHLSIVRANSECRDEIYATFQINPAWAQELDLSLKAGQLDLSSSLIEAAKRIDAKVRVGDIVGRDGVERAWVVGAKFTLTREQPGLTINTSVGAGQITFL
jgi:hypothetical protein